ncbi:hypothetical protein Q4F19_10570 [Sphingomonas sp. BIUV-7]|uniref:O-antigen ligase like membrane protein n=1 Tax=Sphingomonas natans TaxID=3063330 RepID=A0ABT8YAF9_9SPHN|nr:hypothetical protein [Sphingomonas sp. BIUV-7]MDO6414823.1 hypothetical protein [Sphingomonas sp. BIUV-7]
MTVIFAYLCFVPIAALCFARSPTRTAILLVLLGGWWLLPVARYAAGPPGTDFHWWVSGIALPSDLLLTKAWIPPLVAFAGAALREPTRLRAWRPAAIDLPMAAWCLWPLVNGLGGTANPSPWLAFLYVSGTWGLPWLIGRVWLADRESCLALIRAIALSGLAALPIAIIEGVRPAMLYGLVYGPHPYRADGVERYVGYRPIGFLEHGNLYGLWIAIAAFAAVWLRRNGHGAHRHWLILAIVNVVVALASQSAGAILLLCLALVLVAIWRLPIFVPAAVIAGALLLLVAAVHLSGVLPLQSIARSAAGEQMLAAMRRIGRGSFLWRVSQDTKTLAGIAAHPILGTGHWDWWRPYGTRPWGQMLLLIGQYGLAGLLLAWGALLAACVATFARLHEWGDRLAGDAALPLAIIVLLALADATLNAFFFSPAILAAGAIAVKPMPWNSSGRTSRAPAASAPFPTPGRPDRVRRRG